MIRRVGQPPIPNQTYRLRSGVYAILPLKGRFLMTAQTEPEFDVQLPGGGIDPGESPLQALHREVLEEIGWSISKPRRLGAFRRFVYMPEYDMWAEKLCHVYAAHPVRPIKEPIEPDHITLVLSASEAIAALGNDGDRLFLSNYVA
ncbi:MAG: NUDIX domain-containing protein [Sulfitobacter sp.]